MIDVVELSAQVKNVSMCGALASSIQSGSNFRNCEAWKSSLNEKHADEDKPFSLVWIKQSALTIFHSFEAENVDGR